MGRMVNRLTAVTVTKLNTAGLYFDGDGLLLKVVQGRDALTKSWVFRYRFDGKRRDMGLGPVRTISLVEARERARQIRQQLIQNIDPLSARDVDRAKRQRDNAAHAFRSQVLLTQFFSQAATLLNAPLVV
jgi:hypothetical protein